MATIDFSFGAPISLGPMVPGVGPGTGVVPAGIPPTSGLYAIHNTTTNNWYFGQAFNRYHRFDTRAQVVAEMGFDFRTISPINAYNLTTQCSDTGGVPHAATTTGVIDGASFNLEYVLILYMLHWANLPNAATVSNSRVPSTCTNVSQNNIMITSDYGNPPVAFTGVTWQAGTSL